MRTTRSLAAMLLSLFLAGFVVVGTTTPAHAEPLAKFWMYFHVEDGELTAYEVGVGSTKPVDGSIEAYRYGTSAAFPPHIAPRADLEELTFDAICDHVDPKDGEKRVAVLVDFGVEQDASNGEEPPAPFAACAQVPVEANGLQVLEDVAEVRSEDEDFGPSLCAIEGYPASGPCFGSAPKASPDDTGSIDFAIQGVDDTTESDDDEDDDNNLPLLASAIALVVVTAAGGWVLARRNKSA